MTQESMRTAITTPGLQAGGVKALLSGVMYGKDVALTHGRYRINVGTDLQIIFGVSVADSVLVQ